MWNWTQWLYYSFLGTLYISCGTRTESDNLFNSTSESVHQLTAILAQGLALLGCWNSSRTLLEYFHQWLANGIIFLIPTIIGIWKFYTDCTHCSTELQNSSVSSYATMEKGLEAAWRNDNHFPNSLVAQTTRVALVCSDEWYCVDPHEGEKGIGAGWASTRPSTVYLTRASSASAEWWHTYTSETMCHENIDWQEIVILSTATLWYEAVACCSAQSNNGFYSCILKDYASFNGLFNFKQSHQHISSNFYGLLLASLS